MIPPTTGFIGMIKLTSKNPGCLILGFLLVGGIEAPDNNIAYAVVLGIVVAVLGRVIWEVTR